MTDSTIPNKLLDNTLPVSENHFQTIFTEAPLGVAVIDSLTGHIYDANPAYVRISDVQLKN